MLSSMLFLLMFSACGSDDEDDTGVSSFSNNSSSPIDDLSDEEKILVGYWENQTSTSKGLDFLFLADGSAKACSLGGGFEEESSKYTGYWAYDSSTGILATNINAWQWQVTLLTDDAWAGISVTSSIAQSFERHDDDYCYYRGFFYATAWQDVSNPDSTLSMGSWKSWRSYTSTSAYASSTAYSGFKIGGSVDIGEAAYIKLSLSSDSAQYVFDYTLLTYEYIGVGKDSSGDKRYKSKAVGSGTLIMPHRDSYESNSLTFTGTINGTFVIKNEDD